MRRGMRVGSFVWAELALILVLILSRVRWLLLMNFSSSLFGQSH